jgi:hypothetical protein
MQPQGNYFRALRILHTAMLLGQVFFLIIILYFVYSHVAKPAGSSTDKVFQVAAIIIVFACVYGGVQYFKKQLENIRQNTTLLTDKATQYRAANITQWALTEGSCLFTIISFYVTGNYAFAVLAGMIIIYFFMLGPSKLKATIHLSLNEAEAAELEKY